MEINKDMGNVLKISINLDNGKKFIGNINTKYFDKFSDFIEGDNNQYIKLFNAYDYDGNNKKKFFKFLLIPKSKICFYEPFDEINNE